MNVWLKLLKLPYTKLLENQSHWGTWNSINSNWKHCKFSSINFYYNWKSMWTIDTPSHLIYGKRLISAINNEYIDDTTFDISSEQCSNRVKYIQKLFDHYWSRFRKEYLQELSEQQRYNQRKFKTNESLLIDGVVIIKDDNYTPRNQ